MKPYKDLTYDEKLACVSLYPEEAKKDNNWTIRREAYNALGYTEEAKKDSYWNIRLGAYRTIGFTEEAKKDTDGDIRQEAELYFAVKDWKPEPDPLRERIAAILGLTPEFLEKIKEIETCCLGEREPMSVTCNRRLDEIMEAINESKKL